MRKLTYLPLLLFFLTSAWAVPNKTILQGFYWYIPDAGSALQNEESDLWRLIADQKAKEFSRLGFSHVWLPPAGKAFTPDNSGFNVGYAVYDSYDLGEFHQMGAIRTKYGTKAELHRAVEALHQNGIKVVADVVMNHIIGAYSSEPVPYSFAFNQKAQGVELLRDGVVDAHVAFDFNKPNDPMPRNGKYSTHTWNAEHFDGMESFSTTYLFQGKEVDKVSALNDLTPLPEQFSDLYQALRSDTILGVDFDFQHPEVQSEMLDWTKWLVNEIGFDGFRVDAIRHIHIPFIARWGEEMRSYMQSIGKGKDLMIFGEFWDGWADRLSAYLQGTPEAPELSYSPGMNPKEYAGIDYAMDLFDVPLHFDFEKVAKQNFSFPPTRMMDLPDRGLLAKNPLHAVTFVDNHDTVPTQMLASYIPLHTKIQAYTFILLHQFGTPTVFYRDLFKGNFVSPYESDNRDYLYTNLSKLLQIRRDLAYGSGQFYRQSDRPGILGYKRQGDSEHPGSGLIYMIREFDSYDNGLSIPTDGQQWELIMGDGNLHQGTFYLNGNSSFAVWKRK